MNSESALRQLLRLFGPHRKTVVVITVGLLLGAGFNALIPISFRSLLDQGLIGGDHELILRIVVALGVGAILVSLAGLGCDWLYARVMAQILSDIRHRMFVHLQRLPAEFHGRSNTGDLIGRFSGDLAVVEAALVHFIPYGLLPGLDVGMSTVMLFLLDWRLACVAMLIWPMVLLGPRLFAHRAVAASYDRKQAEGQLLGEVQENLAAQPVVKGFGLQDQAVEQFSRTNKRVARTVLRLGFYSALIERSASIGTVILQIVVLGCGVWMAAENMITIGTLTAFLALFLTLSFSLTWAIEYVPTLVQASGGLFRIADLLKATPTVQDEPGAVPLQPMHRGIVFDDVSFGYGEDQLNLSAVSLEIPCGQSVAFVGGSGSGKSTILNLIMRFYDPQSGCVRFDEQDLRHVTQVSLHAVIGIVFQENHLFNLSFADNIRMGRLEATRDELEAAARAAEVHDFILAQPQGYDTIVGERGGRLSGGQRQRVAIARALVRDPQVLLLDEATSALDPATEDRLNATIERIGRGRTVVSVTHRLAATVRADRIIVMQDGRVVETGDHAELIAAKGAYFALWTKQSGFSINAEGDQATVSPERLAAVPVFSALSPALIEDLAPQFVTEQHPAGREIVKQGDPGERFYIVVRGQLEILRNGVRIDVIEDGDCFGEMALLRNQPRTATVRTLVSCTLLSLPSASFMRLLDQAPEFEANIGILESLHLRNQAGFFPT